jgi:transcriptional regulator with XRE-family HTH domain
VPEREVIPELAARLKATREAAGLSQQQAGERSGVHHISIARFETDKRVPTLGALYKLAEAYGVNVCALLPGGVMPDAVPVKGKPPSAPTTPGPGKRGAKGKGKTG